MPLDLKKPVASTLEALFLYQWLKILVKAWRWISSGNPPVRIALWLSLLFIPFAWAILAIFGLGTLGYHPAYYAYSTILQNFIYYYGPLTLAVLWLNRPSTAGSGSNLSKKLILLPLLAIALILYTTGNILATSNRHYAPPPDLADSLKMSKDYYLCPLSPVLAQTTTLPKPMLEIAEDGRVVYSRTDIDWRHLRDQRQQTLYANLEQAVQQQRLDLSFCQKNTLVQPQLSAG